LSPEKYEEMGELPAMNAAVEVRNSVPTSAAVLREEPNKRLGALIAVALTIILSLT
jgi:hypothetical protein